MPVLMDPGLIMRNGCKECTDQKTHDTFIQRSCKCSRTRDVKLEPLSFKKHVLKFLKVCLWRGQVASERKADVEPKSLTGQTTTRTSTRQSAGTPRQSSRPRSRWRVT